MRPIVEVDRLEENDKWGTFGVMRIQKRVFCVTLEPPDLLNKVGSSNIPEQQYNCVRHTSPRFGETFLITKVPGRSLVLFHAGNTVDHTEGCIILAQYWGKLQGERAALNSGHTFRNFMQIMASYNEFHLTIRKGY